MAVRRMTTHREDSERWGIRSAVLPCSVTGHRTLPNFCMAVSSLLRACSVEDRNHVTCKKSWFD